MYLSIEWNKHQQNIYNNWKGKFYKKEAWDIALFYFNHVSLRHTILKWKMTDLGFRKKRCFSCWIKTLLVFSYNLFLPSFIFFLSSRISDVARQMTS